MARPAPKKTQRARAKTKISLTRLRDGHVYGTISGQSSKDIAKAIEMIGKSLSAGKRKPRKQR